MAFLEYAIPFLIVLTIIVFFHELGHYLVARYNGVKVEVFSIGFGPEIFGWTDKADTRWKVSLIPLGGYVRMFGDADASSRPDGELLKEMTVEEQQRSLHNKTVWQRIAVSAAGPAANFLLSLVIFGALFATIGKPIMPAKIGALKEGGVAVKAGLQVGDEILEVNAKPITTFEELRRVVGENGSAELDLLIKRSGKKTDKGVESKAESLHIKIKPENVQEGAKKKPVGRLGIAPAAPYYVSQNPLQAVGSAAGMIVDLCRDTLVNIGQMIVRTRSTEELGGLMAIGDMARSSAQGGIGALLFFVAVLSVNIGLVNLFPIPMLDGGHLLFYFIEAVRRKPVSLKAQEYAFLAGFVVIVALMLFTTWNDLVRYNVLRWIPFLSG